MDDAVLVGEVEPANLLVDAESRLWVTDFGLAQVQGDARMTITGDLVGTLRYMSPEQALAKRVVVDHRTDVYSLGATLYELLTLEPAFSGTDRQELLRQIAFEEPRPPRRVNKSIPTELETIVLKALEKNPAERYSTAKEVADDLERFVRDEPIRARRPTLAQRLRKWGRRHLSAVTAAAVGLLVTLVSAAGSIGWFVRDRDSRRAETNRAVLQALNESQAWQKLRRLPEALSAARRASGWLAHKEAEEAMLRRVEARVADLELLSELEEPRLQMSTPSDGRPDFGLGDRLSDAACRKWGLEVAAVPLEDAAEQVRASSIATELAAALEFWSRVCQESRGLNDSSWVHLLHIARAADPEPLRDRLREALEHQDGEALAALAEPAASSQLPPSSLTLLAGALHKGGAAKQAITLLQRAQRQYPDDFWVNYGLAYYFLNSKPPRPEKAVRYYTAAVALRPNSSGAHLNLGVALKETGDMDGAIAECREAIRLKKDLVEGHINLGRGLLDTGEVDGAIAEFREALGIKDSAKARNCLGQALATKGNLEGAAAEFEEAIRLEPTEAGTHNNLGVVLSRKGRLDEAITSFNKALRLERDNANAHNNLGTALKEKGRLDEAIVEFREALRLKPDVAEPLCSLGLALVSKGEFLEALEPLRRGHELGSRSPCWPHPSAQWVREAERLVQLDPKLRKVLMGEAKPADGAECVALARMCQQYKGFDFTASRFYSEAFAEQPNTTALQAVQRQYGNACTVRVSQARRASGKWQCTSVQNYVDHK
jgi:Flp pilus assembly protein TadD